MPRTLRAAALVTLALTVAACSSGSGGSSAGSPSATTPPSPELVANTTAAKVPLLEAEGVATHTHTQLDMTVDGQALELPAGIGIDESSGHIAALHTHDTTGTIHVESAKTDDHYTLRQFLTVWGMPADPAGQCTFFHATAPCTITVKSKDSGPSDLDVVLVDHDVLTMTVTSS